MIKNEIFIFPTGYGVAWMDVGDADLNDQEVKCSIREWRAKNSRRLTVNELEREVSDTDQIALMCDDELLAVLSDKLRKSIRWLELSSMNEPDFTG